MTFFRELSSAELTSQTTCFSCAKSAIDASAVPREGGKTNSQGRPRPCNRIVSRLSTENHSLELIYEELTGDFVVSTSRLPRIVLRQWVRGEAKNVVVRGERSCLSHSCLMLGSRNVTERTLGQSAVEKSTESGSDSTNGVSPEGCAGLSGAPSVDHKHGYSHYWEAFALRSHPKISDSQSAPSSQQQISESTIAGNNDATRHQEHTYLTAARRPDGHRRQGSVGTTGTVAGASNSTKGGVVSRTDAEDMKNVEAYLVVRDGASVGIADEQEVLAIPLTYKPLALHVASISLINGAEGSPVAVFVASADDAKLRLYMQSNDVNKRQSFLEVTSDGATEERNSFLSSLSFSSPIMALASLKTHDGKMNSIHNYLAIGCQDGTIRVVTYRCSPHSEPHAKGGPYSLSIVSENTFLVDGPIVSIQLIKAEEGVFLTAGSLCGFACIFRQVSDAGSITFQGPFAVVEDLWDGRLDSEDSVFSVHHFPFDGVTAGICVAVGTCSGRLLLLEPVASGGTKSSSSFNTSYRLFWDCQLPYPVYGICSADVDGDGIVELIVTTRKTVHLFVADTDGAAAVAKLKLERLLKVKQRREA